MFNANYGSYVVCHVSLAHTSLPAAAQRVNPDLSLPEATPPSMSASDKAVAACCGGNVQALQVLLQAGISVNYASSSTGSTLVHMAAYCGQVGVAMQTHVVLISFL